MTFILLAENSIESFKQAGGGKAANMARMSQLGINVPPWLCLTAEAFDTYVQTYSLLDRLDPRAYVGQFDKFGLEIEALFLSHELPEEILRPLENQLRQSNLLECFLAVRSSGLDEDSATCSFAGQFSSFLYLKGIRSVSEAIRRCWASGFSERVLAYRLEKHLPLSDIRVAVVIQQMIDAAIAGVVFTRDPVHPLDRVKMVVDSVFGLGEGLVGGELDADHYMVNRRSLKVDSSATADKGTMVQQSPDGGTRQVAVPQHLRKTPSLSEQQLAQIATVALTIEQALGLPQDCEWVMDRDYTLYMVQTRPITTLPPEAFYDKDINGSAPTLWDNSNIVESYSGVTSPLTFSFASRAYHQVYIQFCELMWVPEKTIREHEKMFRNMLGLIRGRIYYNLVNWYRLLQILPSAGDSNRFMETMMGVKQELKPELASLFDFLQQPPKYSVPRKLWVGGVTLWRFIRINSTVRSFQDNFSKVYEQSRRLDFTQLPLPELMSQYQYLEDRVLRRWQAPIINDFLCMTSFGLLQQLTDKWMMNEAEAGALQNDLLCGQGDLESTEPTKMLMRIAQWLDQPSQQTLKEWFLATKAEEVWQQLEAGGRSPELKNQIDSFLDNYGFRCINELKLEENDLHDDPSFVLNVIVSYIHTASYDIHAMEQREKEIRQQAEAKVNRCLGGLRKRIYYRVLQQARQAVGNRENLRFARTKIFGIARHLFRGMGCQLQKLGVLEAERDIFYLTVEEIAAYIEGRPTTINLNQLVALRKQEYESFRNSPAPPERFMTYGAAGASISQPLILMETDLLRATDQPTDENILTGTPCCPGVVEGVVRVAEDSKDAVGINGEILVTARTDPGWVPLFPSCSGLLIERGSLLSHSAVVARELGLPTIVGISGGLMKKLKTGQRVRIDAGLGEVRILS